MTRRNIVTFDKYRKPRNDCRDEGYRDDSDALFNLAQKLTDFNARFALVESVQAQALAFALAAFESSQNPRTIQSVQIVNGRLIITYSDGTTQDAGAIGGGVVPDPDPAVATINNTLDDTQLRPVDIQGLDAFVTMIHEVYEGKKR